MASDRISSTSSPAPAPAEAPAPALTTEQQLVAALAALAQSNTRITELMEQQAAYNRAALRIAPRRKKLMGEYLAERKKAGRAKFLPHEVYQNGRLVNPSGLSQETIDTLDTINTGTYCDGMVDVIRMGVGVNARIHIRYDNGTVEERMMFYMRFPTFTKLVQDIAADMKVQGKVSVKEPGAEAPEFDFPDELKELV